MIKPQFNVTNYTKLLKKLVSQSQVATRLSQSEGVSEILSVSPQISLSSAEVSSGRVNYGGKLIFTILYCDEEGKLCRMQKGVEFTHYCDDDELAPAQTAVCALDCQRVSTRRDGSAIVLTAVVSANITIFAPAERTSVTSCEGAYLKSCVRQYVSFSTFSGECEVEDDFEADGVDDILVPYAGVLVTSASVSAGEVEVSGEIALSLLAMRGAFPAGLERIIPFRCVIPCENAATGALPEVCAELRDMTVNATVEEDRGKCRVEFSCTLAARGYVATVSEETVACDAFSTTHNLLLTKSSESVSFPYERKVFSERTQSVATSKAKLDFSCRLIAVTRPEAEYEYVPSSGSVEGGICAVLLYEQGGDIKSTEITLPFAVRVGSGEGITASAGVCSIVVKQPSEGVLEGEALIKVAAVYPKVCSGECLVAVEEEDEKQDKNCAIRIIIPSAGDGLYEAAKALNFPPEEVASANPGLKYPLSGDERILIYKHN